MLSPRRAKTDPGSHNLKRSIFGRNWHSMKRIIIQFSRSLTPSGRPISSREERVTELLMLGFKNSICFKNRRAW